ncbi:MAG TPA: glycoside hydrolase family 3 N-terminal domain-containing protein [Propionibacteriaceae bacterium]|nr:glycoside hydrolase family 3 N-terminal domain-containing protein [Propionibacteriaceae bacterium]
MSEPTSLPIAARISLTGGSDFWHSTPVPEADLPAVMLTDGPHGVRKQAGATDHVGLNESVPATCFPPAVGLASTWNPALVEEVGRALGTESRALGVGVLLGPGANIKRSPLCGRNFEYFSEDPHLTGRLASAYVRGVQSQGVGTSLKHFAANNQETDRMRRSSEVDERTLREIYLRGFGTVVRTAQPWTVMCSYNRINGVLASQNHWLLTEVLRDEWGFEGFVVSDWGAVRDRVAALTAGLDLEMPANKAHEDAVRRALAAGEIDEATIDRAYRRVEAVLRRAHESVKDADGRFDVDAHHALARRAAEQAIVLLSNDGVLPLDPADFGDAGSLAVIGEFARTPRYQGAGSSRVNPTRLDNALDALGAILGRDVPFAPAFTTDPRHPVAEGAREEAVTLARTAGLVLLFLGLGENHESEGYDRTTLDLPAEQLALLDDVLAVNPNVVVVLSNGSSVLLPFTDRARAVVEGWLLGQAGGPAIADVLFGVVNPSGRVAETIPVRLEDCPSFLNFPGDATGVHYGEGLFVGYRGYDAQQREVAFPFGHGLSYTTFAYSDLSVGSTASGVRLEVTVTNTGDRAGREVVQAYVSVDRSSVVRAPRELKGFADVTLDPGESRRVGIDIPMDDLAYWSVRDHRWVVEAGSYTVAVGASSRDLRLSAAVDLAGDEPVRPISLDTTIAEAMAVPGFGEQLMARFAETMGGLGEPDEDMARMLADIPLAAAIGFSGMDPEQFGEVIAQANAARRV